MNSVLKQKVTNLINLVTRDPQWHLEDELLIQVLGFTLYGYTFALGRLTLFLDESEIDQIAIESLTELGVDQHYATGLFHHAAECLLNDTNQSLQSQLIGIGYAHFAATDLSGCVNAIFNNHRIMSQHSSHKDNQ